MHTTCKSTRAAARAPESIVSFQPNPASELDGMSIARRKIIRARHDTHSCSLGRSASFSLRLESAISRENSPDR